MVWLPHSRGLSLLVYVSDCIYWMQYDRSRQWPLPFPNDSASEEVVFWPLWTLIRDLDVWLARLHPASARKLDSVCLDAERNCGWWGYVLGGLFVFGCLCSSGHQSFDLDVTACWGGLIYNIIFCPLKAEYSFLIAMEYDVWFPS